MAYDPVNDKVLLVMHSYHYGKPDRLGVYVYDPETNTWAEEPLALPEKLRNTQVKNGLYDAELNAVFLHSAGDSQDDDVIWATATGTGADGGWPMSDRTVLLDGVRVPCFLYGTAWKEERSQRLTELALRQGFRGIDTANQRKHYHEAAVGQAIAAAVAGGLVTREDLFLQTKFTFRAGQDDRLPYDPKAPVRQQVEQSFASSLEHLGTGTIDSYLLHGPTQRFGLAAADWEAWRAMEALHDSGRARLIGVSNVTLEQLRQLCNQARVRPRVVQNRCYAARGWDRPVREFCAESGLVYQGFSLLTANREALAHPAMAQVARRHGRTVSQIIFRFALEVGMVALTGTTDADHMRADLDVFDFCLEPEEIAQIERLSQA
jgi:diketogulonate reductase-like aldo/keto reductase